MRALPVLPQGGRESMIRNPHKSGGGRDCPCFKPSNAEASSCWTVWRHKSDVTVRRRNRRKVFQVDDTQTTLTAYTLVNRCYYPVLQRGVNTDQPVSYAALGTGYRQRKQQNACEQPKTDAQVLTPSFHTSV